MLWDLSDLVSSADIARMCGVGRAAVTNWKRRYADFPKPLATVSDGEITLYSRTQVTDWWVARKAPIR